MNKKKSISVLLLLALVLFISCNSVRLINRNIGDNQISVSTTQCGSYEVKSNEKIIGYIVKPFIVEVDRAKEITKFERKLRIKYGNKFSKDYRIYHFTTNRYGDTTILVTGFLSSKELNKFPNWKCKLQGVDTYPKKMKFVVFNCSKNQFRACNCVD